MTEKSWCYKYPSCTAFKNKCLILPSKPIIKPLLDGTEPESNCSDKERICRFLGMQSLKYADHLNRTRIVLPDLIVFAASLACYLKLRSISTQSALGSQETQVRFNFNISLSSFGLKFFQR